MQKTIKIILAVSVGILISIVALVVVFYFSLRGTCRMNCNPQVFVVPQGATLSLILEKLEREKIIKSAFFAKVYLKLTNFKGQIQAGDFKLNPRDDVGRIIATIQKGTLDFWVTIPEGYRAEQVYERILKAENDNKSRRDEEVYRANEGYLFPDTYLIPRNANDRNIVKILKDNFNRRVSPYTQAPLASPSGKVVLNNKDILSVADLIILASLVEREAKNDDERPTIANIIYKRWRADWPLQVDATVQYAVGVSGDWWKKDLTSTDLKIDSLYNTYLVKGLPPAPICNPGLKAIEAVINQKQTDYWFYSTGKDGLTRYAKTLEEHNRNVDRFNNTY